MENKEGKGNEREIKLKVAEAVQDDVNKGIVRIDSSYMKMAGINPGEVVEITGGRKTAGIADRALPGDISLSIIRMDGDGRRNAKTSIGEAVSVKKAEVKAAKKITIAPARGGIFVQASPGLFKQGLLGRALVKGDIISLGGSKRRRVTMGGHPLFEGMFSMLDENFPGFAFRDLKFMVVNTLPAKEIVMVTEETEIEFNPQAVEVKEEAVSVVVNYEDVGGLREEIKKIREMVELPLKHPEIFERLGIEAPKGVLLHGVPGTGKTLLAKAVASETNSNFVLINGPEIMSKWYGESEKNLRSTFEEAEKNAPSIIFIDEIDAIAPKREEVHGEVERRVVAQLLSLMDGLKSRGKVVVIAATNRPNSLDPALRRPGRFDREIEIGVPDAEGRLEVLKIHTRGMPLNKVNLNEIARITHGFVGADISALAREAAMIVLRRILPDLKLGKEETEPIPKEVLEKLVINQKDFKEALKIVRPSAMREVLVETPEVSWEDIGGLEDIKERLKEAIEWPLKKPEMFKRMGIRPPRGILLYGAPGTGKTMLAKAVAKESEANFILVNGPSLLSKWVGESEKAVREIFRKARQTAPTILFFDEIDALAPRRGAEGDSRVGERVVNQLLTEMDGLESLNDVVIIAATNRPDIVDPALLRPGRFDRIIMAPVPDEEARKKIFEVQIKTMPLEKDVDITALAKKTQGYVGADVEGVCREAAMAALREDLESKKVKMEHFLKALETVKPSVDKEIEKTYKELEDYFRTAKAKEMQEEVDKRSYVG